MPTRQIDRTPTPAPCRPACRESTATHRTTLSRRELILASGSLAAGLRSALRPATAATERSPKIADRQTFAYLQELGSGVWAALSTPLLGGDWTTGCNGGLIAGRERVLAIESFMGPAGAQWLADQAQALTGRRPTDVLITHFHGDHANGLTGYADDQMPTVWMTRTTLELIRDQDSQREQPVSDTRLAMLERVSYVDTHSPQSLDLGGLSVTLHPRRGHTPSDVSAELVEPSIVFAGDLVWQGLFPNYRDTEASNFTASIRALRRQKETVYVSGHGGLAGGVDVESLLILVDSIEEAARESHGKGISCAQAAAAYQLPSRVADWVLFNPKYFEVAFKAWYNELS